MKKLILLFLFTTISFAQNPILVNKLKNIKNIQSPRILQSLLLEIQSGASSGTSSGSGTASSATLIPFTSQIPFTSFPTVVSQKQINAPLAISPVIPGAIPGATVIMRLVADGLQANTPVFTNCKQVTGSSGWDNRAGKINTINFQYDGVDFLFNIVQSSLNPTLDLQAPAFVSSDVNATGTVVTLAFNEDLSTSSLPNAANFTGITVTSSSIVNKVVTLNINPAIASGATANINYSGTLIRDLADNSSNSFTTSVTVAAASVVTPVNLASRQSGFDQISVGTYKKSISDWKVALSSTLNFVGDKTFETSDASLAGSGAIIGLDTRTIADATIVYGNVKYWIGYYGGTYKAATNGSQTAPLANYATGDKMQLVRLGTNLVARVVRSIGVVIDLFTWTGVTEPLSTLTILDDNLAQISLTIK